jgi:hypothetical protein
LTRPARWGVLNLSGRRAPADYQSASGGSNKGHPPTIASNSAIFIAGNLNDLANLLNFYTLPAIQQLELLAIWQHGNGAA